LRFVDTADVYGCGHAEQVVGRAIAPFRRELKVLDGKIAAYWETEERAAQPA
jgi:aryl-alcohol dehydrogenase-like predicted oxidoreductase